MNARIIAYWVISLGLLHCWWLANLFVLLSDEAKKRAANGF